MNGYKFKVTLLGKTVIFSNIGFTQVNTSLKNVEPHLEGESLLGECESCFFCDEKYPAKYSLTIYQIERHYFKFALLPNLRVY